MNIDKLFPCNNLSKLEQSILEYIVQNPEECLNLGVRGLSKKLYTSPSTITRLSKRLGYKGYLELLYAIKSKFNSDKKNNIFKTFENDKFFYSNVPNSIKLFIDCLGKGNIFIFSTGFSNIVGKYFFTKLTTIGKKCFQTDCIELEILLEHFVHDISTILIVSKSGETNYCVSTAKIAKENNIQVISFCGNINSSLVQQSDVAFIVEDSEPTDDHNYYPNPFFGRCIELFELLLYKYYSSYNNYSKDFDDCK